MNEAFPKQLRIRDSATIDGLFQRGKRISGKNVYVIYRPSEKVRLGVICGRRLGNAVRRNYVKRILREICRKNKSCFGRFEVLLIAQPSIHDSSYEDICKEVVMLAGRLK
ncbi:MAG: ribonuclease P protein component [Bacteroidetes bacterium]|nr:ribonuclease P protein component [Bacteroidota bacterium]